MAFTEPGSAPAATVGMAREMVGLLKELTGHGPERCTAYFAGDDVVAIVAEGAELPLERTLRRGGHALDAAAMRASLQDIMSERMSEIVERHTGRRVRTVMAAARPDLDVMAELVLLEPV